MSGVPVNLVGEAERLQSFHERTHTVNSFRAEVDPFVGVVNPFMDPHFSWGDEGLPTTSPFVGQLHSKLELQRNKMSTAKGFRPAFCQTSVTSNRSAREVEDGAIVTCRGNGCNKCIAPEVGSLICGWIGCKAGKFPSKPLLRKHMQGHITRGWWNCPAPGCDYGCEQPERQKKHRESSHFQVYISEDTGTTSEGQSGGISSG